MTPDRPRRLRFEHAVDVAAPAARVWPVLITPATTAAWMGGATFTSTWEIGSDVRLSPEGSDHGTVLAFDPERRLAYDLWSHVTGLPDAPGNRATITFTLTSIATGTRLSVTHDYPDTEAALEHVSHFWRVALHLIGRLAEGKPAVEGL